jgi:3-phosphoshikimate 1-carboxyvinyltransferase
LQVEPDASSGSYFWAAGWLIHREAWLASGGTAAHARGWFETHGVCVDHWPASDWQIDAGFPGYLAFPPEISRERDLGDSIMTAVVLTPFAPRPVRFADLGRLRLQECERVVALRTELTKCGARVSELGDALELVPSSLHGADIQTYGDHRMAMCFAILGLKVAGMRIHNPACVKKTFPNFYQKLAAPPPEGLGARILDGATGTPLSITELAAD